MKIFQGVRGTQKQVPYIEVSKDTVYVRTNIERIENDEFVGWQYDEIQYEKNEYISKLTNEEDTGLLALLVSLLMTEVDMLKSMVVGGNQNE